jgi:hypothetical protein
MREDFTYSVGLAYRTPKRRVAVRVCLKISVRAAENDFVANDVLMICLALAKKLGTSIRLSSTD